MVGIRGTWDVKPWGPEEWLDVCAGWYMLEYMDQPDFCDQFTTQEMDYYTQLEEFVVQVMIYT